MKRLLFALGIASLLGGCISTSPWKLDGISAGDAAYDSTRLRYIDKASESQIAFEIRKAGGEIDSYISLRQFAWSPSASVPVEFFLGEEKISASLPYLEGGMRLRIPREITDRMILALHQGLKVSILADGFEETLDPGQFAKSYNRFLGQSALFNILKGPME